MNNLNRNLLKLPDEIYYCFQDYLTQDDYQQLLNTSKQDFLQIRRKSIIYRLTEKYSIKYCEDENYRNQLIEKVENPFKQIIVKLTYINIKNHEDLFDRFPVHLICTNFFVSHITISLRNIKQFTLRDYALDITNLNLSQCENATFEECQGITDISLLKECEHLAFYRCYNITDFSNLGKQRSLCISHNRHLTNVMNFRTIRTLILKACDYLVDVSPLHGVYDLSLFLCSALSDISSLGGHHRLEISYCSSILSGYHALKGIPVVKLTNSTILDVSVLSNSKIVHLEDCYSIVDVSPLRRVRELTLRSCLNIEDISMLTLLQKLTLYNLPNLKNCEGINQNLSQNLSLQVKDLKGGMLERLPKAQRIECSFDTLKFKSIVPFLSFKDLHSLTICYVSFRPGPINLQVCSGIHTVILENCQVKNVRGLKKSHVVRLFKCKGDVLDISPLATVPLVSIIQCEFRQVNYESLIHVPRLKIDNQEK